MSCYLYRRLCCVNVLQQLSWRARRQFPYRSLCESARGGDGRDLTTLGVEDGVKACLETHSGQRIEIVQGNILNEDVDAIVNPTDTCLLHESKLSSDIMAGAGYLARRQNHKLILRYGNIPVGSVGVVTGGFLSCHSVIHAVTPEWKAGSAEDVDYSVRMLRAALHYALLVCHDKRYFSVSMPVLGAGHNGWPVDFCCRLLLHTTLTFLQEHPLTPLKFVCFADSNPVTVAALVNEAVDLYHPNLVTVLRFKLSERSSSSGGNDTDNSTNSGDAGDDEGHAVHATDGDDGDGLDGGGSSDFGQRRSHPDSNSTYSDVDPLSHHPDGSDHVVSRSTADGDFSCDGSPHTQCSQSHADIANNTSTAGTTSTTAQSSSTADAATDGSGPANKHTHNDKL